MRKIQDIVWWHHYWVRVTVLLTLRLSFWICFVSRVCWEMWDVVVTQVEGGWHDDIRGTVDSWAVVVECHVVKLLELLRNCSRIVINLSKDNLWQQWHLLELFSDVVEDRIVWIDFRKEILVAWYLRTSRRVVLFTFTQYPRHPVGLSVFEVIIVHWCFDMLIYYRRWWNLVSLSTWRVHVVWKGGLSVSF